MNPLEDYHKDLMADIRRQADASGIMMVEAFFERMTDRLTEAGELEVADRSFYEFGEGSQRLRIDGYAGDPRDSSGVLGLIICDFVDGDEVLTFDKSKVPSILNPLIRFLKKAQTRTFRDALNESSPGFQVSDLIITTWSQVTKVKLILVSNRKYIGRGDTIKLSDIGDVPVTWSVWDLARFERFDRSGQAREDMVIELANDFGSPVPALKASQTGSGFDSYLLIVPGAQLAAIYDRWGARLLESNVRSFLQAKGKTNKGIQRTIKEEPELFFPYNNGLSATAEGVVSTKTEDGLAIASIYNLQIVNGAQTTGSIHACLKSAKEKLSDVFVQMKLTIVPADRSDEVVPRISEYANTQNKVSAADFFSNHPFHICIERFSRGVMFAAREGERHDSKWFYERSRGQFLNARSLLKGAAKDTFDLEFPSSQLFTKTDLAKFEYTAAGYPYIVSRGAQKNFSEYAKEIGSGWAKNSARYDEIWYRRLIAKAIIFRKLEELVPKQEWYSGGYRANVVTYGIAKLFHDANGDKQALDLDAVWKRQVVSVALQRALLRAAKEAHEVITNPPSGIRNMSEWAKQQACWSRLEAKKVIYAADFDTCLILVDEVHAATRDARAKKSMTDGIDAQTEVLGLGASFWRKVLEWGQREKKLTSKDVSVLSICIAMPLKLPTTSQALHALTLADRMGEEADEVSS